MSTRKKHEEDSTGADKDVLETQNNNEQVIKDLNDKLLRIQAETQNYKRRIEEETEKIIKYANENLIEQMLPILDNFERALCFDNKDANEELSKFLDGIKMIHGSFANVMESFGLKEIKAQDQPFDPVYHQAVLTSTDETKENGLVLEVLQKGYILKDKVIRPAMVRVNNL